MLWLVVDDYDAAPSKDRKDNKANLGTAPPIAHDWKSPFIGRGIEYAAAWLRKKPESVDLDIHHFVVLDEQSADGSVLACKIGDEDLKGDSTPTDLREDSVLARFLWASSTANGKK